MNWITNFVKPKLSSLIRRKDIPDNLWIKCTSCGQMIFHRIFDENYSVCNHCDNHMYLPVKKRFELIFDDQQYELLEEPDTKQDPLKFRDTKKYSERLKKYKHATGNKDAALSAIGHIGDLSCVVFVLDFNFLGGSMGSFVGEMFVKAVQKAIATQSTFIAITASGGARMQEAVYSLMQMPKTVVAVEMLRKQKLPYITVLTNPTMGGVSASFAMLGDITIAEPNALIGFAGPRVIEQTMKKSLPEGFQTAEYLLEHGMVDLVVQRKNLRDKLINIIRILS